MAPSRTLCPQSVWDLPAVLAAFREHGIKERHVYRVWSMLLKHPDIVWADIPDLPKSACAVLEQQFSRCTSTVLRCQQSTGGDTTKLLIQLQDGMQVEAVVMHYDTSGAVGACWRQEAAGWGNKRSTLCVSSQVGCQMGCTFCATGTMGLKGNLCCGEIVEQLVHATRVTPIRNIVFMGMGEPLSNYEAVKAAVGMMGEPRLFGIGARHITVSTVGVIPRIKQMAADLPGVSLALSLHAPTQELRRSIVPSARAYPLHKLMDAVAEYQAASQQRVFVEYVVLAGVNDAPQQAHELGQLLQGRDMVINLIPWNPVYQPEGPFFAAPVEGAVEVFQGILRSAYGLHCTIRQEKGQDISGGASWQLGVRQVFPLMVDVADW
ncbi:hypothetical protein COO60DRAFT_1269332 [Scenedesmus sp. NREL 46B-D3]|nr:hypothetical protein COO60DRAFT_1269332 [Scenedesmus sp. NREL 46B-D3]